MASALSALLVFLSSSAIAFTPPHVSVPALPASRLAACSNRGHRSRLACASRPRNGALNSVQMSAASVPKIIQGGMGVQVSSWTLAREVNRNGELGVISGTAMETVVCRWMQLGDPNGIYRRALAAFPDQAMVKRYVDKYYIEGGKAPDKPFKQPPMWTIDLNPDLVEAAVIGNFAEVWLAKHEDNGELVKGPKPGFVGINCLTKIQLPTIPSLYGALLADVDYVLMGAGIPMEVPGILDRLAKHEDCKLAIDVDNHDGPIWSHFSPRAFWERAGRPDMVEKPLKRPNFLPIVSSVTLAQAMLKRATGAGPTKGIQGFIIEMPTAGGHNAPPRGFRYDAAAKSHKLSLNERGEPVYGEKDEVDLVKFRDATKGLPFYLAGYYARPEKLQEVLALGGAGIQVGTSFAFTKESGLVPSVKQFVLRKVLDGDLSVFTDPVASPTGFPFKVLELDDSLSTKEHYEKRPRVCNLGYLRTPYERSDGKIAYRCASEPIEDYLKKEGELAATEGRKCLCNGLMANAGLPQISPYKVPGTDERYVEEVLITAGDDVNQADLNLYKNADAAEDPAVRKRLQETRAEIQNKIKEVDQQMGAGSK